MSQKIMQMFVLCLAVVLFAPMLAVNFEMGESQQPTETTTETDALQRIDAAELPQSKTVSRHRIKRAVHRFNLGMMSARRRFQAAVHRILRGDSEVYDKNGVRRVPLETEPQCAVCSDEESIDSPFVIRIGAVDIQPHCVDCALDLSIGGFMNEPAEMQTSAPFSAVILCIFFAVCAVLIDPSLACSVALIGATRKALPEDLKTMQKAGFKVRRVAKNRDTACYECSADLTHNGEYGMPYVGMKVHGMKSNKPHCEPCAVRRFTGEEQEQNEEQNEERKPEYGERIANTIAGECFVCKDTLRAYEGRMNGPNMLCMTHQACETKIGAQCLVCNNLVDELGCLCTPYTETEPQSTELQDKIEKAVSGNTAQSNDETGSQLAALIGKMTASGVDENAVRKIAHSEAVTVNDGLQAEIMRQVSKRIDEMSQPTVIAIQKQDCEPIPMDGIQHYMLPEILSDIVHCEAKNLNLTGEAGTGKTHLIDAINTALQALGWFAQMGMEDNREAFILSANKDMQAPELIGRESPIFFETEGYEAGEWAFIKGAILPNFEHGGIIGLDEMDRFADSTLSALNAALANGFVTTPKGERILRHPAAIVIATGNTKGQGRSQKYSAANEQDGATLDRFAMRFIDIDYDPAIEEAICGDSGLVSAIRKVRKLANQHEIKGAIFSYRCMFEASKDLKAGRSLAFIMRRMVMAYGEDAAVKLGHGEPVAFDFKAMWGDSDLFTTETATNGGA